MSVRRTVSILLIITAVIALCTMYSCRGNGTEDGSGLQEGFIPDQDFRYSGNGRGGFPSLESFTAGTLEGGSFTADDLSSKDITIINIWATWCGPCLNEMPGLAAFSELLPDSVGFLTLCADGPDDPGKTADILKKAGYTGMTVISGTGDIGNLVSSVLYLPTTVFVDSSGRIADSLVGSPNRNIAGYYLAYLNRALMSCGLERISLPGVEEENIDG